MRAFLVLAALLTGCGDAPPQYGELVITQESPRAALTGRPHHATEPCRSFDV